MHHKILIQNIRDSINSLETNDVIYARSPHDAEELLVEYTRRLERNLTVLENELDKRETSQ